MKKNINIKKINYFDISMVLSLLIGIFIIATLYYLKVNQDKYVIFLCLGLFVLIGFMIPRHINKDTRKKGAEEAKKWELNKWGFYSRDREGPWINVIGYPLRVSGTRFAEGKIFYSEWLMIEDGVITVNPGPSVVKLEDKTVQYDHTTLRSYTWDGCSPKIWFYWLILIGTPDLWHKTEEIEKLNRKGHPDEDKKFWQIAHHASLVHDALYQYLGEQPITKSETDQLFYEMLRDSGVNIFIAKFYHMAVILFGGSGIDKHHRPANSKIKNIT